MSPSCHAPIGSDWTTSAQSHSIVSTEGHPSTATAAELATCIGAIDLVHLDRLEVHGDALAEAVAELAADAGRRPVVGRHDPLVTQVRALGRLAVQHPHSTSGAAAMLLELLTTQG